ncbi:hypothetical protein D9M68_853900 [compost metagenome]
MTSSIRLRSSSRSAGSRYPVMPLIPYLNALATFAFALAGSAVFSAAGGFFHRRPQPEAMHGDGVLFHLLLAAVRHDGTSLLVDLHHELVGFGL